jgi:hypothetical protein
VVDNTAPAVAIERTTATREGTFSVRGLADDANLRSWEVRWRPSGEQNAWSNALSSGTQLLPFLAPVASINGAMLALNGSIDIGLLAIDKADNQSSTYTTVTCFNDTEAPQVTLAGQGFASGSTIKGTVLVNVQASDMPQTRNSGLARVRVWAERSGYNATTTATLLDQHFEPQMQYEYAQTNLALNTRACFTHANREPEAG